MPLTRNPTDVRSRLEVLTLIGAIGLLATVPANAASREPSEAEMRAAFEARFEAVNQKLNDMLGACNRREYRERNDPMLALQCVSVVLMAQGNGQAPQYELTTFQKLGCEKAAGKPGYVCDYRIGVRGGPDLGAFSEIVAAGGYGQARFVPTDDGLVLITGDAR